MKILFIVLALLWGNSPVEQAEHALLDRNLNHEVVIIFDRSGDRIAYIEGDHADAHIPLEYEVKLRNAIVTHNHPRFGLNSLSMGDLYLASTFDLDEIRAVSISFVTGKPLLCHAWRMGHWPSFSKTFFVGSYGTMAQQEAVLEKFTKQLSLKLGFGYECKEF